MLDRHVKLIKLLLLNSESYLNGNEIADYLIVSNRTVRNDIKYINTEIIENVIISVKGRGYRLNKELYSINEIENILIQYTEKNGQTMIKLAYQLLMYKQSVTLDQLAQDFNLNKNEIIDYIAQIQSWCESFDISIKLVKRKGVTIKGNEMDIRNAILHLNQLSTNDVKVEDFIIHEIPKAHSQLIMYIMEQHLNEQGIQTSKVHIRQLLVHLIIIFKRIKESNEKWDINEEALVISRAIIQDINQQLKYNLSDETAKLFSFFISYYFDKYDLGFKHIFIQSYIDRLIHQMNLKVGIDFEHDDLLRENIYSHFSRTYLRIVKNIYINNPLTDDIKRQYPFVFNALYETVNHLESDAQLNLSEDEIAFLALHFQSSIDRNVQEHFNIVITCYYGLGISSLLEARIQKLNYKINITDTLKLEDVPQYHFSNTDILVTTHEIDMANVPDSVEVVHVSPLFSEDDANEIQTILNQKQNPILKKDALSPIEFVSQPIQQNETTTVDIFEQTQIILEDKHAITNGYIESALEREKFSSTYIGNNIAIPHGDPTRVLKSHVLMFRHRQEVPWKQHKVKLIFFLAIADRDAQVMKKIIHSIAALSEQDVEYLLKLDDKQFKNKIIKRFKE
ncbi:BglG family transcription antiterminator [Mammaliicoccus fleurettii]|uniref:BglG family transcription antiterminator n=1 Tax=Mammaliicoccus fleurettii TaxID=150056 RepID=A0ABS5MQN0_9STAP|nr:BglG family transcription antiterminator [Mammaliicoccus fleurettii]MBL0848421.1 BglG family transcription antiterminator [Mammaliicoccus fleurettii]MBS3673173.1 BglG family transcription antiterminator [Mammaliicoccus fleurettii]MBS3698235.1 BglG family transcription antiterminator [Mammaliicoccus fleurettii]